MSAHQHSQHTHCPHAKTSVATCPLKAGTHYITTQQQLMLQSSQNQPHIMDGIEIRL